MSVPSSRRSTVGYLVVYEDRSTRRNTIRLPVAIVHAPEGSGPADPVLFIMGGPGSGSLSPAEFPGAYPWTSERDFVVFGQRGTRHARPTMECPEIDRSLADAYLSSDPAARDATLELGALACRRRLIDAGIDLSSYHTDAISADIEDLRTTLGFDRWILFGISYGTRVALDVARDYPGGVAAMVLDSPLPPDARFDDESAENFRSALTEVAADCARQAPCREAFPELRARFFQALESAERDPLELRVGPEREVIEMDGARLAGLIGTSSPMEIRTAPRRMNAIAERDEEAIRLLVSDAPASSGFAWGMRLSVWCSEAWPFSLRSEADGPGSALGGYESAAVPPALCDAWGVPRRPDVFVDPVVSDIPTLLIAGEFDAATPPGWAERAAAYLSDSRVVIIRGGGHTPTMQWDGDGCAMEVAAAFIAAPHELLAPDAGRDSCATTGTAPDYDVDEE